MRSSGLTLIELLIALAVIGIAMGVLVYSQITNFQATSRASFASDAKSAATQLLEQQVGLALSNFNNYYNTCLTGSESGCSGTGWSINSGKDEGYAGEGLIGVSATATRQGITVSLSTVVSCYDLFASRTAAIRSNNLAPCPRIN